MLNQNCDRSALMSWLIALKKTGKKPAITVVAKAELAQSYNAHDKTSRRKKTLRIGYSLDCNLTPSRQSRTPTAANPRRTRHLTA